jgi:hypothetical protein
MATHPLTMNLVMQKARADRPAMVKRLNVSGAQVDDIGVLDKFTYLEVCSLSANDISDLAPLASCVRVRELFLRKNDIVDLFQVLHLRNLKELVALTLSENPISQHDCYRNYVIASLPQLDKLDDVQITDDERERAFDEFPDVTSCNIPLPLQTKRELHETQRSPLGKKPGAPAFEPPVAARRTTPPAVDLQPARPSRITAPAVKREDSSDAYTDDSGVDVSAGQTSYDDIPVGGRRPRPKPVARPAAASPRHADPEAQSKGADGGLQADSAVDDSADSAPAVADRRDVRAQPVRNLRLASPGGTLASGGGSGGGAMTARSVSTRPSLPLSPNPMGVREENVVRAVNLLLGELSPAGLDAVRRQLEILDIR